MPAEAAQLAAGAAGCGLALPGLPALLGALARHAEWEASVQRALARECGACQIWDCGLLRLLEQTCLQALTSFAIDKSSPYVRASGTLHACAQCSVETLPWLRA